LPHPGRINNGDGKIQSAGTIGFYWSSSPAYSNSNKSKSLYINSSEVDATNNKDYLRAY
jgi:hypothetical protein